MRKKISFLLTSFIFVSSTYALDSTQIDEVTVISASGFEQNIAEAPASISVISANELKKKSYTDVLDAVKNIPGVFVFGGGGSELDIKIRGMEKEYTLYLVDGRPISASRSIHSDSTKTNGKVGFNLPNIDMIERIEVIRGPMSSLYGSEAMGGVINIITKKVSTKWTGSISSEYTKSKNKLNNDSSNHSLYINGPIVKDKLNLSLNALKEKTNESDYSDEHGEKAAKKRKSGGKLNWKINDKNNLTFNYEYSKQEFESSLNNLKYGQKKNLYALTHQLNFEKLNINSYLQKDETSSIQGNNQKENILTFNTKGSYFFENDTLTFGGQYKKEEFSDDINELSPKVNRWISALFLENEWTITNDFILTTGLRYNYDELFNGELTPRIYAVYSINENIKLKGGISTGYKQPGITETVENYGYASGRTFKGRKGLEVGNPNLEPEKSINYELGVNYEIPNSNINTSLTIFKTNYKNKLIDEYTCGGRTNKNGNCFYQGKEYNFIRQKVNVDEAEIKGLELTFDYKISSNIKVSANYSYTKSKQKSGEFKGESLNKIPKNMYNINFDWELTSKLSTWAQYNYRGRTSNYLSGSSMEESIPGYKFIDLGLVYKMNNNLTLKAGIYNLSNKLVSYDEYETVLDGRRVTLGLNYNF